jgi:biofilm PGA synthesis N-glycosyltransferase PgaC
MTAEKIFQQFIFWGIWLIIPLVWEIIAGFLSAIIVLVKYLKKKEINIEFYPTVAVLIPAYRSENTIKKCLESVAAQDYPKDRIEIFVIGNGEKDGSFDIFNQFHLEHPEIKIWWHHSPKGKSKALNKGVYGTTASYIINIDSDGWLDKRAIRNVVARFEKDKEVIAITGVILTDPDLIEHTSNKIFKVIRRCEFFEYAESFLAGRNFQSATNTMFTMAGAFSCFRREALMKTQLFNMETVGEDTHMTYQIRKFAGGKIVLCEDAFFYIDPIESIDRLYIQRQRWQRGELEAARLFNQMNTEGLVAFFRKFSMRVLISDHTLAFPRLIWFFAIIYLVFINYPLKLLVGANLLLHIAYATNSFIYMAVSNLYLKKQESTRRYLLKHWYVCLILPIYRFIVYWIRVAGIINSLKTESRWHAPTFKEEISAVKSTIGRIMRKCFPFLFELKKVLNDGDIPYQRTGIREQRPE